MNIAETIRRQIGGGSLFMLGARNLLDHGNAFSFRIRGSRKVNYVKITLDPSDTYTMEFKKIGRSPKFKVTDVAIFEDVYCDMLHSLIEDTTGLRTRI